MAGTRRYFSSRNHVRHLARIVRRKQQAGELTIMPRHIDPSRDLLFGLLALQNGLINQVQLVAAFQAWTLDKARALADHLIALGHLNDAQRDVVAAMADLHVAKHGDVERSLAAIPAGRSTQESLARLGDPDLEGTLAQVRSQSTRQDGDADADRTTSYSVGSATSDGLRFRVLRPHARGGLGAVFVALDNELHREVALKQILDSHADDPVSRQRFLLEAEVTGGLEHPGVVPVYGLGTYGDGRPYYAMRFIRGDSLKEAIDRFHKDQARKSDPGRRALELRKLLRRFTDVCNAIEYAHSRGVLHRDLKPGNIIVGKHGETLVVDWGLAKATGRTDPGVASGERALIPSSASGSAETVPGSALGTPAYMSPEQAEGDIEHLGPRSDVYSLGATLYYLLSGQPPLEGEIGDVLRAVQRGEVPPPRQHDTTIDAALEAVCLKAMAHQPADRYPAPKALAEDIERWMADEPVAAWREPVSRRARRWARRNRSLVTGAAAAVLAGVVGLAAVLAVQTQAKAGLAQSLANETNANQRLAAANADLARSRAAVQARYDLAVEAIKTFHTGVSEDFLLKEDQFKELRERLLKSASDFYGRLGALLGKESDPASRRALAQANFEVAELTSKVGQSEAALAAHHQVLAYREALAAEPGADDGIKADVGRSLTSVAALLEATGQSGEALAMYRQAERLLVELAGSAPASARSVLASCRFQLGSLLHQTGHAGDGLAVLRLARTDQEALASAAGASTEARRDLAATVNGIGSLLARTGKLGEAEAQHRQALALLQRLVDGNPAVTEFRYRLATSHGDLGRLLSPIARYDPATHLWDTSRSTEAEAELRQALVIIQKLAKDNPAVTQFRRNLVILHGNLGGLLMNDTGGPAEAGRPAEVEAELRQALVIIQKLADEHPERYLDRKQLARLHQTLGVLYSQNNRLEEGEASLKLVFDSIQSDLPVV
jgi:serine/threonine-protein kinase